MFKIQGLNFNKSGNLVCVLQTLFLDQEPNQLGNKSNRGSKIESAAVFHHLKIFEVMEMSTNVIRLACLVLVILLSNLT